MLPLARCYEKLGRIDDALDAAEYVVLELKYVGPRRIKVIVGLPPGGGEYKFAYYLETFGIVDIPPS